MIKGFGNIKLILIMLQKLYWTKIINMLAKMYQIHKTKFGRGNIFMGLNFALTFGAPASWKYYAMEEHLDKVWTLFSKLD